MPAEAYAALSDPLSAGAICTRIVTVAPRQMAVDEAARLMRTHHVGTLVVVDEAGPGRKVVGLLTDRDIVTGILAPGLDPGMIRVEDLMSTDLVLARESDSILDVLGQMRRKGVRRVPVTDELGVLVGLVAIDDVLEVLAQALQRVVQVLDRGRQREPEVRP